MPDIIKQFHQRKWPSKAFQLNTEDWKHIKLMVSLSLLASYLYPSFDKEHGAFVALS